MMQRGLYVDSVTNSLLDGDYLTTTKPDAQSGGREHKSKESYNNGIPVKGWVYLYGEDTIHTGRYLEEETLKSQLATLATAQRVDLNLWQEGHYPFLTVQIINPKSLDSTTTERVYALALAALKGKYPFRTLILERITDSAKAELKKVDLE